ncbi:MAG TPA: fumarylacetoacetate hydrolase family protein [Thermodesulfobacteriota bacterium]|nr:fumarylacetoacetate hydrolase family protein [Thermodesulfobacteriota bacterium]
MTLTKRISYLWLMLCVSTALAVELNVSNLADLLIKAQKENQLIPVLSNQYPELHVETAYLVQRAYVKRKLSDDQIAGFKAGLTSSEIQKKFCVTFPVSGVLFGSGKKLNSPMIDKSIFKVPMIETEIGFLVGKPITHSLKNVSDLYEAIQAVLPVVELPDLGFTDLKKVKVADIIAANVSSSQFIVGTEKHTKSLDLDNIIVTLSLNGQVVNQGKGRDALGDQWKAALWLVNAITKQGRKIEPGYILITGVLGKMIPRKEGKYIADYGELGKIEFEIK